MPNINYTSLPSPCWILEEEKLIQNLQRLSYIKQQSGARILLALKGYALWKSFPTIAPYLDGCCASGLHEAKLAQETFHKEVHTYAPAFKEEEFEEIATISQHLVFNSPTQSSNPKTYDSGITDNFLSEGISFFSTIAIRHAASTNSCSGVIRYLLSPPVAFFLYFFNNLMGLKVQNT